MRYRLGDAAASRRALAASAVGALTSLAPLVLAVVLVRKLGWQPSAGFWAVGAGLLLLVVVRSVVAYGAMARRLRSLEVTVTDETIEARALRDSRVIERASVTRITEVDGPLGGMKVESAPDAKMGVASVIYVPRGGEAYGAVRTLVEGWGRIERRGRRGPLARFVMGALVVAAIFFVPFLLDDVVGRSRLFAGALVVGMWLAMRGVVRGR